MTRDQRIGFAGTGPGFGVGRRRRLKGVLVSIAFFLIAAVAPAAAQETEFNINSRYTVQTVPLRPEGPFGDGECAKGLDLEPAQSGVIHRFRVQDLPQLGSKNIVLVDPDRQRKEVADNDPERTIHDGKSIEDAVSNGFAHGLVTLSEIRFSKDHKLAIVSYGFFCGSLCGNGGTVVLEKTDAGWRRKTRCSDWVS